MGEHGRDHGRERVADLDGAADGHHDRAHRTPCRLQRGGGEERGPADEQIRRCGAREGHQLADLGLRLLVPLEVGDEALQELAAADDAAQLPPLVVEDQHVAGHHRVAVLELHRGGAECNHRVADGARQRAVRVAVGGQHDVARRGVPGRQAEVEVEGGVHRGDLAGVGHDLADAADAAHEVDDRRARPLEGGPPGQRDDAVGGLDLDAVGLVGRVET